MPESQDSYENPFEVLIRRHNGTFLSFVEKDDELSGLAFDRGYGIHAKPGSEHGMDQAWRVALVKAIIYTDDRDDVVAVVFIDDSEFSEADFDLLLSPDFGWKVVPGEQACDDFVVHVGDSGLVYGIGGGL